MYLTKYINSFRQDGIQRLKVPARSNFIPYASRYYTFNRFVKLLKVIAGDAMTFPNSSISDVERVRMIKKYYTQLNESKM